MPRGPNGEKRPGGVIRNAVYVAKVATGEVKDELPSARRNGGLVGGKARTDGLTAEQRSAMAQKAARARWKPQSKVAGGG